MVSSIHHISLHIASRGPTLHFPAPSNMCAFPCDLRGTFLIKWIVTFIVRDSGHLEMETFEESCWEIEFQTEHVLRQRSCITGDGFGNQSYLMVHLLTLANFLLVQFRHEKTTPLPFLKVFTIEDERDDGRYVTVLKLDETTIGRYVFILATAQDNTSCNSTRWRSFYSKK